MFTQQKQQKTQTSGVFFVTKLLYAVHCYLLITACGNFTEIPSGSVLKWEQSRANSERYAYLTDRDFNDNFLMGASVISVDDFLSAALNMTIRPMKVKLFIENDNGNKLHIKMFHEDSWKTLLRFDVNQSVTNWEVDFASSGNDIEFNQMLDVIGGIHTLMDYSGRWLSEGTPKVLQVSQDENTVVIDLQHLVKQTQVASSPFGQPQVRELSDRPGRVNIRLWLKRQESLAQVVTKRTIGMAKSHNLGFFSANLVPQENDENLLIQRFPWEDEGLSEETVFYLKDFPAEIVPEAKRAVLSWNQAFRKDFLKVALAPKHIDAGDPRYHVIKWYDGTDKSLPWSGVAKMIVDPDSGLVMSGGIYIQGSALIDIYRKLHEFSRRIASSGEAPSAYGRLGEAFFHWEAGEHPVVAPFFTDLSKDFDRYIKDYYREVIAHELGHVLGLRHNFKGSTAVNSNGLVASVMDYLPRQRLGQYEGPGFYDMAAIRWAYYGETPPANLPFCTDEDLWKRWDCNQGDYGEPLSYVTSGLLTSSELLSKKPIAITEPAFLAASAQLTEMSHKFWKLKTQMNDEARGQLESKLLPAYSQMLKVEPDASLSSEDREIVKGNLNLMRQVVSQTIAKLKAEGKL